MAYVNAGPRAIAAIRRADDVFFDRRKDRRTKTENSDNYINVSTGSARKFFGYHRKNKPKSQESIGGVPTTLPPRVYRASHINKKTGEILKGWSGPKFTCSYFHYNIRAKKWERAFKTFASHADESPSGSQAYQRLLPFYNSCDVDGKLLADYEAAGIPRDSASSSSSANPS